MDLSLLNAILPVFLIVGIGALMQFRGWLAEGLDKSVMQFAINLLVPCLILDSLIGDKALNDHMTVLTAFGLGFGVIIVGIGICLLGAPLLGLSQGTGKRTFAVSVAIQNYGYIAIPVLVSVFGEGPLGILFLFAMGVEIATWTVAVSVLGGSSQSKWRQIVNGPFVAVLAGLALHYAGAANWMPVIITTAVDSLGSCAVPMCLFMIGATIVDQSRNAEWTLRWPTVLGTCVLRLALLPTMILTIAWALPLSLELKQVLLVQASMPAAVFPIILARIYGGHPPTAIQIALVTNFISVISTPVILELGRRWLEI